MLRLRADGLSYDAIAQATSRSSATVYRYLHALESTAHEAFAKLRAAASESVDNWTVANKIAAAKGEYKGNKDLLEAVGVIQAKPDTAVQVNVNMPGADLPKGLDWGESAE